MKYVINYSMKNLSLKTRPGFKEIKPPGRRGVRTVFPYSHSNSIAGCSPAMDQWAFLVIATDDTLWNYNGNWTQIPIPQP